MGNREDLLAAAKKVILERGLAKVTARDIAGAAGVSLAAIGYHFGSKDRLISEAVTMSVGSEIGDGMDEAIRAAGEGRSLAESFAPTLDGLVDVAFRYREQLMLSLENGVRIARSPDSQAFLSEATAEAYTELAALLREVYPDLSDPQARAVAKLYFVLFQGIAMLTLLGPGGEMLLGDDLELALSALQGK
ncbi:TetR/AcrR family transcriptional regulator [Nocardia miyunensis]|uniref:TetR/AcrR family transcriptional regulator n=1 Tax=Nocardia miyunensis TaxID=282684 RepID=UPI0008366E78|nr:TetR/AcrR family transcriptional regulator [Nocardia miyunensis]